MQILKVCDPDKFAKLRVVLDRHAAAEPDAGQAALGVVVHWFSIARLALMRPSAALTAKRSKRAVDWLAAHKLSKTTLMENLSIRMRISPL